MASHFSKPGGRGATDMVAQIADIDFIATETEAEALLAEQEFIKRHRPVFNVRLRDDKGDGWYQVEQKWTVEIEGQEKPALFAESVGRLLA